MLTLLSDTFFLLIGLRILRPTLFSKSEIKKINIISVLMNYLVLTELHSLILK